MDIQELTINQANITVVFDKMDKDIIRRDVIKKSLEGTEVVITDFPDILVVILPEKNAQANFADNRLSITSPCADINETSTFLTRACEGLSEANTDGNITAYGFNLHGRCKSSQVNVNEYFLEVCCTGKQLAEAVGAEIVAFAPNFSFHKHDAQFNVSFKPVLQDSEAFDFHCNIHFESTLPDDEMNDQFIQYTDYFRQIVEML